MSNFTELVDCSTSLWYTKMKIVETSTTQKEPIMKERFETFTGLIAKISRNIRKIKNLEMAEYELRSTHVSCLFYLYSADILTATDLCERCEEDKATISRALDFLEENGFVTCETKSAKRYKSPLLLTEKGREAGGKIFEKVNRVLEDVGAGLTDEEREIFYRSLTIISNNLDRITRKTK